MFSKPKSEDSLPPAVAGAAPAPSVSSYPAPVDAKSLSVPAMQSTPKVKPAPSVLSSDLIILGNVRSSGDIQVEGNVEGDVRAATLIVGETATVKGEVIADEVVVHGRVVGRLRGLKVRLTASARCEGDIVHKTIAIESGAHFEGSVQRQEDPLAKGKGERPAAAPAIAAAE